MHALQHDASLRLLHAFLNQNDPNREWAGLAVVDLGNDTSSGAGSAINAPADKQVLWCCKACLTGGLAAEAAGSQSKRSGKMVPKADYDKLHTSLKEAEEEVRRLKHIVQCAGLEVPARRRTGEQLLLQPPRRRSGEQQVLAKVESKGRGAVTADKGPWGGADGAKVAGEGKGGSRGGSRLLDCFTGKAGLVHPDPQ